MPAKKVIKKSALAPTVLISGGAGFVGSYLASALLSKDARVVVLDNFKTGKKIYVNELIDNPKFALFDVDINDGIPEEIESVDYIFHLAGFEEYLYAKENVTLDTLLTNAFGTKNLLDLARVSEAKFLLASTIDVYQGMMSQLDITNYFGYTQVEERTFSHTEAKRYAEAVVWEYHKKYQTDARIARLPEVYGPRMSLDSSGSLGGFVKNLMEKRNLTIFGDGVEKENYVYVTDAVTGLIRSLFSPKTNGNIYSLVSKDSYAVLETAYLLKSLADGRIDIDFKPRQKQVSLKPKVPDTSNLDEIGWEPKVIFRDGLLHTLTWFGYRPNEHSFKPDKYVKDVDLQESLFSLSAGVLEKKKEVGRRKFLPTPDFVVIKNKFKEIAARAFSKTSNQSVPSRPTPQIPQKETAGIALATFALSFLLIFILIPALQVYLDSTQAYAEVSKYPKMLTELDTANAIASAQTAYNKFSSAQSALAKLSWVFNLAGQKEGYVSAIKFLGSAKYFSKSAYNLARAALPIQTLWESIRPNTNGVFNETEYDKSKLDLDSAKNSLQLALADYKYVNKDILPDQVSSKLAAYSAGLDIATSGLEFANAFYADLPNIIGVQKSKKYLILFQNSNEIRPTGGFIGSYAVLDLTRGKIERLVIDDIYNPDGQIDLKGIRVPVAPEIADFLDEDRLHLRNANYNPDFTKSADIISSLYTKVTGSGVDGVIAMDLSFAQKLLGLTGPIFLTAYNEEISADNLYERTQFHSEFNYKDGSDQKKSFLTILGSKMLERIFALPKEKMPQLLSIIFESLNEKHLLVSLPSSQLSGIFKENGWDGSLVNTSNDYLYVVNSNLGGTKANYYVKNKMNYEITSETRDGLLRGQLTLTYNHKGESLAWPSGPYTDYVRVITQAGSRLTGAKIEYADKSPDDIFKQIKVLKEGKYNSFETSFVLAPKSSVKLTINYDLPQSMSITTNNKNYALYWQKQPGTDGDEMSFSFSPPFGVGIVSVSPKVDFLQGFLKIDDILNKNKEVSLKMR